MKLLDILKSANSNLWRNKLRSALTILAIFIGSFTIILNSAINSGVNSFIDKQVASAGGEGYMEIAPSALMAQVAALTGGSDGPQEYSPEENASGLSYISEETLAAVAEIPGIKNVKPSRSINIEFVTSTHTDKKFKLRANELPSNTINIDLTAGRVVDAASSTPELTLLPGYPTALGFADDAAAIDQEITLTIKDQATGALTELTATIVGVQAPSVVSMGRSWVNEALNNQIFDIMTASLPPEYAARASFATAEFDPSADIAEIKAALEELKLTGMTIDDQIGMMKTFFDVILVVFSIFGGIALLAASIGIINTLFMSVQERTREIGLMKAMGLSSGKVFLSFSFEAVLLGLFGSIIGIALSIIVGLSANAIFHEPSMFLADFPTFNLVEFTAQNLLIITGIICFIAFLAGTLPALRAAKKDPIESLRYE